MYFTTWKKQRIFRLFVWTVCLCPLLLVSLWLGRDIPVVRWTASRGLAAAYSVYDPFSQVFPINAGPSFNKPLLSPTKKIIELQKSLQKQYPDYSFETDLQEKPVSDPSSFDFYHESLENERVRSFTSCISDISEGGPDVFELCQRTRNLTHHGVDQFVDKGTDPLHYLKVTRKKKQLTCRYFAVLFGAVCVSNGYTSRLIGLSKNGTTFDHAVTEVFVPQFGKWILLDPDFNVAYRQNNEWLNAAELHEAWINFQKTEDFPPINLVVLGPAGKPLRETNLAKGSSTGINLEFFEYVFYTVRNNYLSASYPTGHPHRSKQYVLLPEDETLPPSVCPDAYVQNSLDQIYWPVGRTAIQQLQPASDGSFAITFRLTTWTPNFSHFSIKTSNPIKQIKSSKNLYRWQLQEGKNKLKVCSVNQAGLKAEKTALTVNASKKTR